ncbi:GIY-YIG nuclease family protein [Nocardia noduli]|uniref:GIY-YIG nuclease family protein n=1 Tax=Nocardia noduli TaxID=2815722 RepID=UPI001C245F2A|nr:GIY-YIG nuclease family protein [Nocardia noduli]
MGYIYAFRLGDQDLFKIGQTSMTPAKRRSALQTPHDVTLSLFDAVETDEYKALEKYIKDTWEQHRSTTGGKEVYRLTENEAAQLFTQCRAWLTDELPKARRTAELEAATPEPTILPSDATALELREQWLKLREEELRLKTAFDQATAHRVRVETELKLAIGTSSGIAGVATWEAAEKRRINPDLVQTSEPELYEQCLVPTLSADKLKTALKALGRAEDYERFQEVRQTREFKITE